MSVFLGEIQVTENDLDLLENLIRVNGTNGSVFIYDKPLRKALQRHHYVHTDVTGRVWGSDRLKQMLPQIRKIINET